MDILQVLSRSVIIPGPDSITRLKLTYTTSQSSADMEVRLQIKAMSIILSMTSSRNVEEVALFLEKQLQKTQEADYDKCVEDRSRPYASVIDYCN